MPLLQSPTVQALLHKYVGIPAATLGTAGEPSLNPIPGTTEGSLSYQLGAKIPQLLEGKQSLAPVADWMDRAEANPWRSGLYGGLAGAAGGAILGHLLERDPAVAAMLGAGGAGGGAWLIGTLMNLRKQKLREQHHLQKAASFYGHSTTDPQAFILARVAQDPSIGFQAKSQISQSLDQLTAGQISDLAKLIRTAVGAGVGALVAKYLLRLGLGGTILGALVGGYTGSRFGGSKSIERDLFGNARLLQ